MGVDINELKFLLSAKANGVDFSRTITIGRQRLCVRPEELQRFFAPAAIPAGDSYAEWVFRQLGASQVDSVDISGYEGATILHDMNNTLPAEHRHSYSAVVECGTLEHLFNFPVAIRNCMELVAPGGHLLCCTVANNFCGHGFYQFSPELFFRVLCPKNGFQIDRIITCDAFRESEWYRVSDPEIRGRRVEIVGPYAVSMLVLARRISEVEPFAAAPQQSDYAVVWSGQVEQHADHATPSVPGRRSILSRAKKLVPRSLLAKIRAKASAWQYPPELFQREPSPEAKIVASANNGS